MTVIELGELSRDEHDPPPAPPVRLDRRLLRQTVVVVLTVLTVLGVTGSTPSVRHILRPLWGTAYGDGDAMAVDATTLYADQRIDGDVRLTAYDLATGRKRWTVPAGGDVVSLQATVDGVLVLPDSTHDFRVQQDDGTFVVQTQTSSTIARDTADGHALWTRPGDALAIFPGSVLLGQSNAGGRLSRLSVIGLRDGVTRWTTPVDDAGTWTVAGTRGRPTYIVLGDSTGRMTVLDYADGTAVHSGRIGGKWARPGAGRTGDYTSIQVIGDRLVISRAGDGGTDSAVYRVGDFQELWHATGFVIDCGAVLCSMEDNGLSGRDPATGRRLWSRSDLNGVWPLDNGRFLGNGPLSLGPYQLIDGATGRGVGDAVRGQPTWAGDTLAGSVLLIGTVTGDYHRSSVIRFDLDSGRSNPLGTIDEAANVGCLSTPGYLVCQRPDGFLDIIAVD